MTFNNLWLVISIVCPFTFAVLGFLVPRWRTLLGLSGALGTGVSVGAIVHAVVTTGMLRHVIGGWPAPLGIVLRADGLATIMLVTTAIVGVLVSIYAVGYLQHAGGEAEPEATRERRFFWPLWLLLWGSMNALFLSGDAFNLYVTLELLGLSATALVALSGEGTALGAAMRYLLVSLFASLSYLLGVGLIYGQTGALDLILIAQRLAPGAPATAAASLIIFGLIFKTALFPMHFWLPPAHANAPAPVSAILSGLVVKATFYLLLRFWFEVFPHVVTPSAGELLGTLGAIAIIWGSIQALLAKRLKLLVAYSTVAQLGYLFLVFALTSGRDGVVHTAWNAIVYFVVAHACAKSAMFLAAGSIMRTAGHDRIGELQGVNDPLPVAMFTFGLAGVSLMGLPPSGGFMAKWLLLNAALATGQWMWAAVIVIGGLLAAAYVWRVVSCAFVTTPGPALITHTTRRSLPRIADWAAFLLAALAAVLGLVAPRPLELLSIEAPFKYQRIMETMP